MASRRGAPLGWGSFGVLVALVGYAAFRIFVEAGMRRHGLHPTGMLGDDSYYPLAFARELQREGSWLFFHNPYGTLDDSPGLFDGLAVILRLISPLWQHDLLAFDLAVNILATAVAGFCFARLCAFVTRQSTLLTGLGVVLVVAGTGIGFLTHALGLGPSDSSLRWGTGWAITWIGNQTSTWEVVYHAIFWAGALCIVQRKRAGAWAAGVALLFLHPFSVAIYVLFAVTVATVHTLTGHPAARELRSIAAPLAVAAAADAVLYELLLPHWSHDADFIRRAYTAQPFEVPAHVFLLFTAPALLFLALVAAAGRRDAPPDDDVRPPWSASFLAFAAVLSAIGMSYHVTGAVPQPAHWTRVYVVASLVVAALALPRVASTRMRPVAACALVVTGLAIADSLPAAGLIRRDAVGFYAPAVLDPSDRAVVATLAKLPPRLTVYIRACTPGPYVPGLEYSISALTPQRVIYGHAYFSPDLQRRARVLSACAGQQRPTFPRGTYIVSDPGIAQRLEQSGRRTIGAYDFGVLR